MIKWPKMQLVIHTPNTNLHGKISHILQKYVTTVSFSKPNLLNLCVPQMLNKRVFHSMSCLFIQSSILWIPRYKSILGVGLELAISHEEQISIPTKLHALQENNPRSIASMKMFACQAVARMWCEKWETAWRQQRLLASPRLIESDSAATDHLFAQPCSSIMSNSLGLFATCSCGKTFLQTVHGDMRQALLWNVPGFAYFRKTTWPSGFLTHVHKSTWVKRKTGLILAEPWAQNFFRCQLEIWSNLCKHLQ